jgi:hypothetical protein
MKTLNDPKFIESALSDFQVVSKHLSSDKFESTVLEILNLSDDVFDRADKIRGDTNAHMLEINKSYAAGDRERFFALFQVILKQEESRDE